MPSDRNRLQGKMEIHRRLADDPRTDEPRIRIFPNCVNLIKQLSGIPLSKTNAEDVDTKAEDHAYDALRYGCMSRPTHPKYAERFRTSFIDDTYRTVSYTHLTLPTSDLV